MRLHGRLRHPGIVQLYVAFEDAEHLYLVQEYMAWGDLFEFQRHRGIGYFSERQKAGMIIMPLLQATAYLHNQMVSSKVACVL